jgi:hypothetical protein
MPKTPSVTRTGSAETFAYTPPQRIYRTVRVLFAPSAACDAHTLAAALRGIWRFTPLTRALVVQHPALEGWMLGANMAAVDLDALPLRPFVPPGQTSTRPIHASHLFADCDGSIALTTVVPDALDAPPSLAAMAEYASGASDLAAVFRALGPYFAGSIVRLGDRVVWGDDILDVDATVYRLAGKPVHPLIVQLRSAAE